MHNKIPIYSTVRLRPVFVLDCGSLSNKKSDVSTSIYPHLCVQYNLTPVSSSLQIQNPTQKMMQRETWSTVETSPHPGQVLGLIGQRPFDVQQCGTDDDTDPLIVGQAVQKARPSPGQKGKVRRLLAHPINMPARNVRSPWGLEISQSFRGNFSHRDSERKSE